LDSGLVKRKRKVAKVAAIKVANMPNTVNKANSTITAAKRSRPTLLKMLNRGKERLSKQLSMRRAAKSTTTTKLRYWLPRKRQKPNSGRVARGHNTPQPLAHRQLAQPMAAMQLQTMKLELQAMQNTVDVAASIRVTRLLSENENKNKNKNESWNPSILATAAAGVAKRVVPGVANEVKAVLGVAKEAKVVPGVVNVAGVVAKANVTLAVKEVVLKVKVVAWAASKVIVIGAVKDEDGWALKVKVGAWVSKLVVSKAKVVVWAATKVVVDLAVALVVKAVRALNLRAVATKAVVDGAVKAVRALNMRAVAWAAKDVLEAGVAKPSSVEANWVKASVSGSTKKFNRNTTPGFMAAFAQTSSSSTILSSFVSPPVIHILSRTFHLGKYYLFSFALPFAYLYTVN